MIISDKQYEPETLHRLWAVQVEILDVIHDFCQKHQIKYSIAYGTLLGAVRHKGFIPWDADIDIMMLREDYERFRTLWLENPPEGYVLVDDALYDEYHENFMKIRKKNTTFIQFESEYDTEVIPLGIFVDIFAFDRVAPKGFARKKQYIAGLVNMLLTRGYVSGKGGAFGLVEKTLLSLPKKTQNRLKRKTKKSMKKCNGNHAYKLVSFCTFNDASLYFDADLFDDITQLEFCEKKYCAVKKYDDALRTSFGDYMQLPPEGQRASHYPLLLDFDKEYKRN